MEKTKDLTDIIAENIAYYRKQKSLTQLELADILNYSDKSISKWERAEGLPSVIILAEIAEFFGITVNDMMSEKKKNINYKKINYKLAYFFGAVVIFCAILGYGLLTLLEADFKAWLLFIYALPIFSLIMMIFFIVWKRHSQKYFYLTTFIWTLALSIYVTFNIVNGYLIFIITIPIYLFIVYLLYVIDSK